ncbi:MAG TPA: alginate lyase family protein [Desulfomonilaceae bacterium]|nr:alginate lyase family protein [Desulfomonilaceae bacterium]
MSNQKYLTALRTVKHLRASQVFRRLVNIVDRDVFRGGLHRSPEVPQNVSVSNHFSIVPNLDDGNHPPPNLIQNLNRGIFRHLNEEKNLGRTLPDWMLGQQTSSRLWTITLHYHRWAYDLAELAARGGPDADTAATLFKHYVMDWITRCEVTEPGARDLAWNSYAISTRIPWWIRSYQTIPREWWSCNSEFLDRLLKSLWMQAAFLHKHLEYDLRANHLLRNAVGLGWAGRFFSDRFSEQWLRTATRLALDQIEEQVLPDGGHFERSAMYHLLIMEDLCNLARVMEDKQARDQICSTWERMARCLVWLRHPDGRIPILNDASLNGASAPDQMLAQAELMDLEIEMSSPVGGKLFPDFGVFAWHGDPWTVFFDVGQIGVDYQPGHGHADTLTAELSFKGHRLFVDPGTYGYDLDDRRRYDRATASHNTVCVDGFDSSEVWHIFRCGRRAYPEHIQLTKSSDGFSVSASHTGYCHLPGSPRPTREITLRKSELVIMDRCEGSGSHRLTGGWLLAPGWTAKRFDEGWEVSMPACGCMIVRIEGSPHLKLTQSRKWYHPEFGLELLATRLEWSLDKVLPAEIMTIISPQ